MRSLVALASGRHGMVRWPLPYFDDPSRRLRNVR
jgi:hypothetical protein